MKKIVFTMMVMVAMVATSFSLTSCSADELAESITTGLTQMPLMKHTWRNDAVSDNTPDKKVKYLDIYEKGDNKKAEFKMVEVQNGVKYVSYGEWSLSSNGQSLTLKVKGGSRKKGDIRCHVSNVGFLDLNINIDNTAYAFTKTKTSDMENYIK